MKTQDTSLHGRQRRVVHALALAVACLAGAWLALETLVMSAVALPAGGFGRYIADDVFLGFVANMLGLLVLFGFIGLVVVAVIWKGLKMKQRAVAAILVAAVWGLVLVGAAGMVQQPGPPSGGGGNQATPQFSILIPSTVMGTPRDTQAELFDTDGGTGGGGETPTATLAAYGTNAIADRNNKQIRETVTITTGAATSGATFSAPDSLAFDLSVNLVNPRDSNGDGVMDSVAFFGRVRSITATTSQDGNQTVARNIFMFDNTFGWYIGWTRAVATQATDGQWISACPAGLSDLSLPTAPNSNGCLDWANLGVSTGSAPVYISYAHIMRNYGPFGYTQPTTSFQYTIVLDIGTPALYYTYTISIIHA